MTAYRRGMDQPRDQSAIALFHHRMPVPTGRDPGHTGGQDFPSVTSAMERDVIFWSSLLAKLAVKSGGIC